MKQEFVKLLSTLIVFIVFGLMLIMIGYSIDEVDSTPYPAIACFWIIYLGVGDLIFTIKRIEVPASSQIEAGCVDLLWGIKHYYWVMWWPRLFGKK